MNNLTDLPNIGQTMASKLIAINIKSPEDLKSVGSKRALIQISNLENSGACINMLYALEGAVQNIRWHGLSKRTKQELRSFYELIQINKAK